MALPFMESIPFGATFFVFSDYMRPAVRCSFSLQSHLCLTHDSVALGEDGPTHQPIEQLESLLERCLIWFVSDRLTPMKPARHGK